MASEVKTNKVSPATATTLNVGDSGDTLALAVDAVTGLKVGSDVQGDVLYYDGTDYTRLGAGTSGYFLKTQGTSADPIWAEASSDFVKIHTLTASADSDLTFSSTYVTSDYKQVIFMCYDIVPATDTTQFKVQFSDDNGVSYDSSFVGSFFYSYKISTDTHYSASTAYGTYNADHATLAFDLSNVSNHGLGGELRVQNPGGTTNIKTWQFVGSHITHDATPKMYSEVLGGYFNNNAAINNVKFLMASGNITSGSIVMWGMK